MKRDMELCREILMKFEELPYTAGIRDQPSMPGRTDTEVAYHIKLLVDGGLVEAQDVSSNTAIGWIPRCLTYQGHELLDAARSETVVEEGERTDPQSNRDTDD
jgi:hypothetical protein